MKNKFHHHIFKPVKPFTTARKLSSGVTDYGQICPCVSWSRLKVLLAFTVHSDLISNTMSTDIKRGKYIVYVLRLSVVSKILHYELLYNIIFQVNPNTLLTPLIFYEILLSLFHTNISLFSLSTDLRYTLYI